MLVRAALQTGRYPHRMGLQNFVLMGPQVFGVPLGEKMLPQYMKDLGYETNFVGKWHLGFSDIRDVPSSRGYDYFYGSYNNGEHHFYHQTQASEMPVGYDLAEATVTNANPLPTPLPDWTNYGQYSTDIFTAKAIQRIGNHAQNNADKPFFLSLHYSAVHDPIQPRLNAQNQPIIPTNCSLWDTEMLKPENAAEWGRTMWLADLLAYSSTCRLASNCNPTHLSYPDPANHFTSVRAALYANRYTQGRRGICAMMSAIDEGIGAVRDALHANGMDDTMFVFISDNGGVTNYGSSNLPFRGLKATTFNGGVVAASFISGSRIPKRRKGAVWNGLIHATDLLPTILEGMLGQTPVYPNALVSSFWSLVFLMLTYTCTR